MADEKLPDIIPLGGPIPPADEYEPIIDHDSGVTVYRPRKMRATPPAVKGDSNVMGWMDGSGHQLARSWYKETRDDLIGEVQGARSVIRNLSSLKPLSPEEENELVELKGRPMLPPGLFASGPYMNPQQSFTPEFTRRTELERRKNAPQLIATVKEGLNKKLDELEETFATLQLYQGTTEGMKDFEKAKGFLSTVKAFANAPIDSTTGLVFENAVASGKAAGAAAAATAATALTGGGALVPIMGIGVGAGVGGVETYDSELAKKLAENPEFAKNPRAFLANLDKTVASAEQEKDFQAQRDNAIGAGLTETLVTAAAGGLTKLLPQGTTPVRKFLWDGLGEVIEENLVGDAENLRQHGKLMSLADRFRTTVSTVGQTGMTHGGGVLASKAGEVSGVSKLVSDAFKPQLQVDQTTLTPMAPRPFSLMPPTAAPQIAVDLNTLTPIAAPVDPAQLQINPASLTPVDPAPASLPNVIPLPGPSASAPAAQAGTTQLPDIIPLSGPTSTAQEPIAASRGDQPAPRAQGEARPQIPFAPQSQAPQANPLAPAQPAQGAPASAPQADATAPQATGSQAQPGVSSLFTPPPAQPSQRQANPLAPVSTGAEQLAGGDAGESARNNVVPREAMQAPRKGNRFVEVDPRLVNDEHERTSDMSVRDPKNVVSRGGKSRIEHAKDYIRAGVFDGSAPGGKAEAAEIGFGEPGKLAIVNGRHRLVASEQLGAPSVTVQVPEADADEIARRFAPRPQATQATAQPAAPQGAGPTPAQPGRAPISLAPVSNAVTNPEVGRQRPKLSVRDEAAWTELERKAAELDRRREARSQAQDRNTDPSTRRRGPEQIAQRLINELRKGGSLTHQEATAALRVTEILMERGYMDNLAVSVSNVEKGGGVRGEYNPVTELVKMFVRNTNRPGIFKRTFAHEVSHHLERMVPAKDLEAARQQFLRERAQWLKDKGGLRQLLGEGNWLDKSFTNAQIKQFLGGNTMDPSLISKYFIKDTNTGKWRLKLTDETYKFTNFSEYFAERVSEIAGERDDARLNPQDGPRVWAKIKDMLAQIKKALIDVFGKDKVEAIWDKFQDGEYTSDFKRDKLAGYDRTGGQNPIMDDPRTADYRASRFGPADADRQTRVDNIDKLEPNKAFSAEDQSKIDDMRFAGESILDESAGQADDTIAARRDEQVSMASVEKDAKKSGKIAGATLYISSRMLEGTSFDDAFGEVVSKYGNSFSKFREVIQQTTERIAGLPVSEAFDEAEKLASTRYPMAVGALEDPNKRNLISGLATILADPEKTKKSARELRKVTGFKSDKSWDDQRVIREFIKHVEGNLDWLYKGMRDRLPKGILERSKLWYVGANAIANRLAKKHSIPVEAAAGVLAVLSPQMDWYKNVSLAERALEIVVNKKNHVVDNAMVEAILKRPSMVKLFMAIHEANIYGEEFDQKKTKWPNKGDFTRDSKAAKALQEKLMAEALPILRKSGVIPVGTKMGDVKDARLYAYLLRAYDEAYNPREYAVITPEGGTAGMSMNEENTKMNDIGWGNFDIIEKVRPLVENPTMENISRLMGGEHKVRNFYNNIIDPNAELGQVTIDTHAVAAALLEPLAGSDKEVEDNLGETGGSDYTGLSGLYPIYAQAYQNAAKKYGLLPREMQSITWEGVRGLFTNKFKNATNKATIKGHWADYAAGKISLSEVRSKIEKTAGGFKPPTWYGRDGQSPEGLGSTQDQGAVDPRGVREGRGRPGPGRAGKGPKGPSVRSARDDGENTPIPGGYREAFFQAKKGAGAAEPKQIKFWTDLGHDPDADTTKQFLWSIDRRGQMHVISVSDLNDKMSAAGASLDNAIEAGPSDGLSEWTRIPTHLDWDTLGGEYDRTTGKDLGIPRDVLSGPAHGRIDATGDVLRVSLIQKNQSTPEIKADMQRHVKEKLGEALGEDPTGLRGYDFTDAGPFTGPEAFSARDEEPAGNQFLDTDRLFLEVDGAVDSLYSPTAKKNLPSGSKIQFESLDEEYYDADSYGDPTGYSMTAVGKDGEILAEAQLVMDKDRVFTKRPKYLDGKIQRKDPKLEKGWAMTVEMLTGDNPRAMVAVAAEAVERAKMAGATSLLLPFKGWDHREAVGELIKQFESDEDIQVNDEIDAFNIVFKQKTPDYAEAENGEAYYGIRRDQVYSARDDEGSDEAFKPLEVDQSSPSGKVSIPGSMGYRFGALAMGDQGRPGTIRYFDMNGVTSAPTQIALMDAKSTEEKADIVGKLPHADVRISPDGRYAEIEWIQTPEGVRKLGVGGDFARRVMFDLRNRNVEEISFRAINPGSMKILLRGMKNSLAGKQEDFRVTSLEDARDVMDGDETEYAYDVVISRVGADNGEGYALDTALDRALTNGRGSEDIKRQLSLANNPGENYFPGQKGAVPTEKGKGPDYMSGGAPNVRQLPGQSGEDYFGRVKMKPGYQIGSDNKVVRSGDDAPHWLDIGHDNRTVDSEADGYEHIGMPEIWATDAKSGKMRFFAATFTDDTHEALLGGSQGLSESRYGERGRIDHAIIDTKGNLIARGRISVNGTISQKPDPARIKKIKEAIAARAVDEDGNRIKVSYSDYDVFWYGNNDDYKAANNLSVDDYGPGIYSARDESTNEGDRDDAIPTSKSGVISDKDGKPVELYRGQYGRGVGRAIQTKSGSITFSNEIEDARLYAKEPNNYDDTAEEPKILRANLTIKNPWINSGFDHSITFNDILRGVGGDRAKAMHFMRKHAETFENSGVWEEEINPDGKYKSAKDFFTKHPERINELLGMAFVLLDDPMFIEQLKINDFDGAIHGAYGAGVGTEFKVFDADQVTLTNDEVASARDEDTQDLPSTGSTARKAGLAAGALALAPTTVEAATGAAKTGAMIAGVAAGDLIAVATGIAFTSSDRLLKGLNPIAANMHLLANDTKSPTMKRIAEMFNRLGGNTSAGAQETYHEERDANRRVYRNKLAAAFEPLAKLSQAQIRALDITIARALAGEIPMPSGPVGQVVQNLQALSDELYRYLREAGIDVNYAKDYAIPHSFNAELVAKDEQAFIDLAEQAYIDNNPKRIQRLLAYIQQIDQEAAQNGGFTQEMTERKDALNVEINKLQGANPRQQAEDLAAAILSGEEGGDQSQGLILASNPRNQNRSDFLKDRVFEQSARGMLREYFQNDPRHAWNNYIARATTLAEFARRFGSKGETWNQLVADMRAEKVKEVDITRIKEHVLDAMGALTPAAQGSHAMANALVGLSNMSKLKSTFLTNFLEAQAQAIPGNLLDAAFAPVVMLREFAAVLVELSPRQRALLKQYLRMDLNTETGNMELARIVGLMDSAGVHNIMENSAYALENKADFREDSRTDRAARAVSRATGAMAQAYGIEASENAKRAMGARYASGRLDQHVSEFLRDNILARALKKVGYTGDVFTTRNEAIMRLRRAGINDNNMAAFGAWWEKAKASGNFNELLADTTDPMAALARKAIRMESARAMVNSNRAMKPGGVRNKAISQDNFFGKIVMSFLNYPAAFREQVAKPMARDIATGVRGYESEGGQATFFSPAERARMVARVAAIPAMAISAAVFLALRVLALGDEEDKEELKKKTLLSHMIDGVSYTGLTGGKTEAVQRARRGQLPPLIDEGVRLAKNLDRESTNANGKERAVTKSVTRSVAVPVTQAVVSRYAPMPIAAAVDQVLASRTFNEAVVDTVAGPKAEKKKSGGSGRDTGREGSGRSGGRPDGR